MHDSIYEAEQLLDDLRGLRRRTRASLGLPWFPLVWFGSVTVLGAGIIAASAATGLVVLWATAGGVGWRLTRRYYAARSDATGVTPPRRIWHVALALFGLCFIAALLAGWWGGLLSAVLASIVVVVLGYCLLGWLNRDPRPPAAVAAAAVTAASLAGFGSPSWLVELAFGCGLVIGGLVLCVVEARQQGQR